MDIQTVFLGLSLACMVVACLAASKAAWMEREAREHRRVASVAAWRSRCHAFAASRDAETVRGYAASMTGEKS